MKIHIVGSTAERQQALAVVQAAFTVIAVSPEADEDMGHGLRISAELTTSGDELTSGEVAQEFKVHTMTVLRWEKSGALAPARRLPGGHRRYSRAAVEALKKKLARGAQASTAS